MVDIFKAEGIAPPPQTSASPAGQNGQAASTPEQQTLSQPTRAPVDIYKAEGLTPPTASAFLGAKPPDLYMPVLGVFCAIVIGGLVSFIRRRRLRQSPKTNSGRRLNGWQRLGVCLSVPWVIFVFLFVVNVEPRHPSPLLWLPIEVALISLVGLWVLAYLLVFAVRWVLAGFSNPYD